MKTNYRIYYDDGREQVVSIEHSLGGKFIEDLQDLIASSKFVESVGAVGLEEE